MSLGSIAVDMFFTTSGFLVTASLFARQSAIEFILARFLRIFPALLVMLVLTIFGIGVFFTSMPIDSYLSDSRTYIYFLKCSTLIGGITYNLPGVFDENPYKNAVNGSLWTMPHELRMYALLVIIWISLRTAKSFRLMFFELIIVFAAIISGILVLALHFIDSQGNTFPKLFFMFFAGSAFYVLKKQIIISNLYFILFIIALSISAIANKHAFFVTYILTTTYILFYIAYIPSGIIRKYNLVSDYSYGMYIYAFPIQQSVAALIPGVSVLIMTIISLTATLLLAIISWHFIERHALDLKIIYADHTRKNSQPHI